MFVRIQNLTFSIYANTNVIKGLVNIGKPCVLFLFKTKHMKSTSMWITRESFWFFKLLCSRGSLMFQFTNLDEKKTYNTYSYQIKCQSFTNNYLNILINIALLNTYWRWAMTSYTYAQFHLLKITLFIGHMTMIIK